MRSQHVLVARIADQLHTRAPDVIAARQARKSLDCRTHEGENLIGINLPQPIGGGIRKILHRRLLRFQLSSRFDLCGHVDAGPAITQKGAVLGKSWPTTDAGPAASAILGNRAVDEVLEGHACIKIALMRFEPAGIFGQTRKVHSAFANIMLRRISRFFLYRPADHGDAMVRARFPHPVGASLSEVLHRGFLRFEGLSGLHLRRDVAPRATITDKRAIVGKDGLAGNAQPAIGTIACLNAINQITKRAPRLQILSVRLESQLVIGQVRKTEPVFADIM